MGVLVFGGEQVNNYANDKFRAGVWSQHCSKTDDFRYVQGLHIRNIRAGVKWLSCEPMLERLTFNSLSMFDWVVIGGQTKSTQTPDFQPQWGWVEHLWLQARQANCGVYWKENLTVRPKEYPW